MKLRQLRIQDFRNLASVTLECAGDRVFFLGANGQGKTNLLEAIGYVSALRAFRPGDNRVLLRTGATGAALGYTLEHERLGRSEVIVRIRGKGKEAAFDGTPVKRLADFIGRFPTVLFASEDIHLVRGAPVARRRWLDLHLAALDAGYLAALQSYHRALDQRNQLLKRQAPVVELVAFEHQLAPAAATLVTQRRRAVTELAALAGASFAALTGGEDTAALEYAADTSATDAPGFLALWEQQRARDLQFGATQRGPHRDDLELHLNGRAAAYYGSEGQQRALVLALRFAQLRDARARTGLAPVVLADDVLGELDPARRARFWSALDPDLQLFATGTAVPEGSSVAANRWQIVSVRGGVVE
jgi:DNA replication and repair protein RecF